MGMNLATGLKVLDITNNYAAPRCSTLLSTYGAEVIHVEKPVLGNDSRKFPPMIDGVSMAFGSGNHGKKSIVLNLKDPKAVEVIKKMIVDADILIESYRPGVMDRLGLGYEVAREINPKIIYCSVSAYGQKGPYAARPGYDILAQAFSGMMHKTGEPDGAPTKSGVVIGDSVGALNSFAAVMAALYYRERTGLGQHLDISLARGLFKMCADFTFELTNRQPAGRSGNHDLNLCPYGVFTGNNGKGIVIGAVNTKTWVNLCGAMGREDLAYDPDFVTNDVRVANREKVISLIEEWLRSFDDLAEAEQLMQDRGVPCCRIYDDRMLLEDPHVQESGWIVSAPVMDSITSIDHCHVPGAYFEMSECQPVYKKPPTMGEHNHEVLDKYMTAEEVDAYEMKWEKEVLEQMKRR